MEELIAWAKKDGEAKLVKALEELDAMVGMKAIKENVCSQVKRFIMYKKYAASKENAGVNKTRPPLTRAAKAKNKNKPRRRTNWTRPKRRRDPTPPPMPRQRQRTGASSSIEDQEEEDPAAILKNLIVIKLLQAAHEDDDDEDWSEGEESEEEEEESPHSMRAKYHTLLLGPPGCGKTTVAYLIRNVWRAAGVCNDKFDTIGRTHVMSKWQGEASEKIRRKIEDCRGGVLFVDECYGLVHGSNDTYGNEVLTAIVQAMTDSRCTTTFVLAGYEKETKAKLFGANCGLERRFDAIYSINKSSEAQLVAIFKSKNKLAEWAVDTAVDEAVEKLCKQHAEKLAFGGGDVVRLLEECHRAHMDRFFPETMDCRLTTKDVEAGFSRFLTNTDKKEKEFSNRYMYL